MRRRNQGVKGGEGEWEEVYVGEGGYTGKWTEGKSGYVIKRENKLDSREERSNGRSGRRG